MRTDLQNKSCLIYTRCSTEDQGKKGNSHEYQLRECRDFALRHHIKIISYYSDTVTGTSFHNRTNLDLAYHFCLNNKVDYVLVYKIDRFGRNTEGAHMTIRKFRDIGVEMNFSDEWINYQDPSWPLMMNIKLGLAETESLKISDRTKDGIYQTQLNGYYPFNAPAGYVKVESDDRKANGLRRKLCVPDTEKARIIKTCFEHYAAGSQSKFELFRSYGDKIELKKSTFCRMFHNIFYTGFIRVKPYKNYLERIVPGKHKAIISMELYEAAQKFYDENPSKTQGITWYSNDRLEEANYYLKGIIHCPSTLTLMTAGRCRSHTGTYYHYYSTNTRYKKKGGKGVNLSVTKAHSLVDRILFELKLKDDIYIRLRKIFENKIRKRTDNFKNTKKNLHKQLSKINARLEIIMDDYSDGNLSVEDFRELKLRCASQQEEILREIRVIENKESKVDEIKAKCLATMNTLPEIFKRAKREEKALILRSIFPEGFVLDIKSETVRTPGLNKFFAEMLSESASYEKIKTDLSLNLAQIRTGVDDRTKFELDFNLFYNMVEAIAS